MIVEQAWKSLRAWNAWRSQEKTFRLLYNPGSPMPETGALMSKKIIVTCPNCDHTHKVELDLKELEINPSDKEYDLSQVERILGLSRETLKRYIYSGRLNAEKSGSGKGGSKWMVKATDIAEFRRKRAHQQKT